MVQNGAIFRALIEIGDRIRNKRNLTQNHPVPAIHSDFIHELQTILWTVWTNSQESGWDMLCDGPRSNRHSIRVSLAALGDRVRQVQMASSL